MKFWDTITNCETFLTIQKKIMNRDQLEIFRQHLILCHKSGFFSFLFRGLLFLFY